MKSPFEVIIPLINPNEPEAVLAVLHVENGNRVETGELLCVLETTKATIEVTAEFDGYVAGLHLEERTLVTAGDVFCTLVDSPEEVSQYEFDSSEFRKAQAGSEVADGFANLRITKPALKLAEQNSLDPAVLPKDKLITEKVVIELMKLASQESVGSSRQDYSQWNPNTVILYGGGGHAKMLIDLIRTARIYKIAGIIDDGLNPGSQIMGVPVLGGAEKLPDLRANGILMAVNAVGGIGNIKMRIEVFKILIQAGFGLPTVIHPSAVVESSSSFSQGAQVFAQAYIGGNVQVGFGGIISTGSIISHDCILDEYAIISPGAVLAGEVKINKCVLVGMGVTINLRVVVGENTKIGNSATIISNVPANSIVRAGMIYS